MADRSLFASTPLRFKNTYQLSTDNTDLLFSNMNEAMIEDHPDLAYQAAPNIHTAVYDYIAATTIPNGVSDAQASIIDYFDWHTAYTLVAATKTYETAGDDRRMEYWKTLQDALYTLSEKTLTLVYEDFASMLCQGPLETILYKRQ